MTASLEAAQEQAARPRRQLRQLVSIRDAAQAAVTVLVDVPLKPKARRAVEALQAALEATP